MIVDIPLLKGQDSTVDSKIAPLGVLKRLENGRIDRDGKILKRRGFAPTNITTWLGSSVSSGIQVITTRESERVMVVNNRLYGYQFNQGIWRDWGLLPDVGVPERIPGARNMAARAIRPSLATVGASHFALAYESNGEIYAAVFDAQTNALRSVEKVSTVVGSQARPRIVAIGTTLVCIWIDISTTNLKFSTYSASSNTAFWSAPTTLAAVSVAGHTYFDVCPYDATQYLIAYQENGTTIRGAICNAAGVVASQALVTGALVHVAVLGAPGEYASIAYLDAANTSLRIASYPGSGGNPFGGAIVGPTLIDGSTTNQGPPSLARKNATTHVVSWSMDDAALLQNVFAYDVTTSTGTATNFTSRGGVRLVSKVTYSGGKRYYWAVNKSTYERAFYLCGEDTAGGADMQLHTVAVRGDAADFGTGGTGVSGALCELIVFNNGFTQALLTAVVYISQGSVASNVAHTSIDILRAEFAPNGRYQQVELSGTRYFSGGLVSMYDGQQAYELGFQTPIQLVSVQPFNTGGSLANNGVYRYVATREWYDARGNRHISGVSDPLTATLGATDNRVHVNYDPSWLNNRGARWLSGGYPDIEFYVRLHLWRTENNGTIFYRITPEEGLPRSAGFPTGPLATYIDQASDASIRTNPIVYTQGQRGAISGPLQHDPPPPAKYLWAGKDRVILGGLETPDEVRWSKTFYPGEPPTFSNDFGFRKRLPGGGKVTAVASLDDAWIVFTATGIFAIFGDGPDDSGVGNFTEPRAIPSSVGLTNWKALLETPMGLFFSPGWGQLFLLPRGLGEPIEIGRPVKDILTANASVSILAARMVTAKNIAIFLVGDGSIYSRNLVFDFRTQIWSVDPIGGGGFQYSSITEWEGRVVLSSDSELLLEQTGATVSDRNGWFGMVIETHALRPAGMQANCRVRKVAVLGEYQGASNLQLELAIDDAQAFAYTAQWAVTGLVAGDPVQREWRLPFQKFGSCRLKITEVQNGSSNNFAIAYTGLSFEVQGRTGMPRLREGHRA